MNRYARDRRENAPKPVKRIELSEAGTTKRLIAFCIVFAIGVVALVLALNGLLAAPSGWVEIEYSGVDISCAEDFSFTYCLGNSENGPTAERKALSKIYSQLVEEAYRTFTVYDDFDGTANMKYVNDHPNEDVQVSSTLYSAMQTVCREGRYLYLAPVYSEYYTMFNGGEELDPMALPEVQEYFSELLPLVNSDSHVHLDFLGDDCVRLNVSEEYLTLARDYGVTVFIDFGWMKNAFICDMIADGILANGYPYGTLLSYDGFARSMDSETDYTCTLYQRLNGGVVNVCQCGFSGARAAALLTAFRYDPRQWMFAGERTGYIDTDGLCKSSVDALLCTSDCENCGALALAAAKSFISDGFVPPEVSAVWCEGMRIGTNDPETDISQLYSGFELYGMY